MARQNVETLKSQACLCFIAKTNRWSSRTTENYKVGRLLILKYIEILSTALHVKLANGPGTD